MQKIMFILKFLSIIECTITIKSEFLEVEYEQTRIF